MEIRSGSGARIWIVHTHKRLYQHLKLILNIFQIPIIFGSYVILTIIHCIVLLCCRNARRRMGRDIDDICVLFNNTCSNVVCVIIRPRIFIVDEVADTKNYLVIGPPTYVRGESFLSLIQI